MITMFYRLFKQLDFSPLILIQIFFTFVIEKSSCIPYGQHPKVLLVSFDGFRWDYLNRTSTPNFDFIINNGIHATRGIVNAFITKTLPNHYSIITGLYEESHGMVANTFYDPNLKEVFELENKTQNTESKWFDNGGEPIWVTNQKGSESRSSGVVFWPGDAASVKGYLPTKYLPFDPQTPFKTRVDIIISWLTSKEPVNLGLLYFEEPDGTGHGSGPDTQQMTNKIRELDSVLGYLLKKLNESKLLDEIDLVVTSDHGMAETPEDKVIDLDSYIDKYSYKIFASNPIGNILPNPGVSVAELIKNLSNIPHVTVYEKANIPDRYHYKASPRIQPILIVLDEGYSLRHNGSYASKGNHGYDNQLSSMHPVFVAMGPSFKKGYKKDTFHNVDIYPLLCYILGVQAAPNNGSLSAVNDLLNPIQKQYRIQLTSSTYIAIAFMTVVLAVAAIFSIGVCLQVRVNSRHRIRTKSLLPDTNSNSPLYSTESQGRSLLLGSDSEEEF